MCAKVFVGWRTTFLLVSLALTLSSPASLEAQVFQWTDSRGVIHFTDNPSTIPNSVRDSPRLTIRTDLNLHPGAPETSPEQGRAIDEPFVDAQPFPAPASPKQEPPETPTPVIHYSPQHVTIVVINSVVRKPKRSECPSPQGCRGTFRPNFDDRRFIHPSVFDGGSRQFIRPDPLSSAKR